MQFSNKVVLVTGGAANIGKAIAQCFIQEGAKVVIADYNDAEAGKTCAELSAAANGGEVIYVRMDVTAERDIEAAVDKVMQQWGRIDVLVNNIGLHIQKPMMEITSEDWDRVMSTNLKGHFLMSKAVLPHMLKGSGNIVHISSVHALQTLPGNTAYSPSKGGIVSLTRAMALEFAPYGIRVNAVLPGLVRTQNMERRLSQVASEERDSYLKNLSRGIPLERPANPKEIGEAVTFLASEKASFITGVCLPVDGGVTCRLSSI